MKKNPSILIPLARVHCFKVEKMVPSFNDSMDKNE